MFLISYIPLYYSFGSESENILHTTLRHGCSYLKSRLVLVMEILCSCNDFENNILSSEISSLSGVHCSGFTQLKLLGSKCIDCKEEPIETDKT